MPDVRAVIELRQGAAGRCARSASSDHLMKPADGIGGGAINIVPPGYCCVEAEGRGSAGRPVRVVMQRNARRAAQLHQPQENAQQVADCRSGFEAAIREAATIRRKAEAQQIERIELARGCFSRSKSRREWTVEKRLQGGVRPFCSEIAQKELPCPTANPNFIVERLKFGTGTRRSGFHVPCRRLPRQGICDSPAPRPPARAKHGVAGPGTRMVTGRPREAAPAPGRPAIRSVLRLRLG